MADRPNRPPVLRLSDVCVRRGARTILGPLDWQIEPGDRWAIVGPNGSGKTTLLQVASTFLWPTSGSVEVLGERIGATDARQLRRRIGYASAALAAQIPPDLTAVDVVKTAREGALAPWWHQWTAADRDRALDLLDWLGVGGLADRTVGSLSTGERQRVQIARALMPDPDLLLLDEPAAGLDLGAREDLVSRLTTLAAASRPAAVVLVTHHLEEIPSGFERAMVLREGRAVSAGRATATLTSAVLNEVFGVPLRVELRDGRWSARSGPNP